MIEDESFFSAEEYKQFYEEVFNEDDQKLFENIRFKVDIDQKGWGHNSIYTPRNFKNGTLEALERTRRDLSCESAEKLIDILYTLGYSSKRIIYIIWKFGYQNISFRDYRKYKENHKARLEKLRKDYIKQMDEKKNELFQNRQKEVLEVESETLSIYINNIKTLQDELNNTPRMCIDEPVKFKRISGQIDTLQEKIDKMHAISLKREASIDIGKQIELKKALTDTSGPKNIDGAPPALSGGGNSNLIE